MVHEAQLGPPIEVPGLPARIRDGLLALLRALEPADWARPTVCPGWTVREVAAHLLHDDLRRLSAGRDGWPAPAPVPGEPLAAFLDRSNGEWVAGTAFLSPAVLVDLLAATGPLLDGEWARLDPAAPGAGVSWAGADPAPGWLDLARECTEAWVHQQQIRDATGRPGLTGPEFLDPVLDTLVRALPHTYREVPAEPARAVVVTAEDGARRLTWSVVGGPGGWTLRRGAAPSPAARVTLPAEDLWRLATGGLEPAAARARLDGDRDLGRPVLALVSAVR